MPVLDPSTVRLIGEHTNGPVTVVVVKQPREKRPVNHVLHGVLTLVTLGLWLPVWAIVAIAA